MPATYEPIASVTSTSTDITISNIPSTYTDLVLVMSHLSTTDGPDLRIRFNGDTTSSYSRTFMYGFNDATASGRESNQTWILTAADDSQHTNVIHIMSYANTNVFKTVLDSFGGAGRIVGRTVGLWRKTDAITSINLTIAWAWASSGITVNLYGIKAA
jgi:hypothetical protein